jgi:hypothetical protein
MLARKTAHQHQNVAAPAHQLPQNCRQGGGQVCKLTEPPYALALETFNIIIYSSSMQMQAQGAAATHLKLVGPYSNVEWRRDGEPQHRCRAPVERRNVQLCNIYSTHSHHKLRFAIC